MRGSSAKTFALGATVATGALVLVSAVHARRFNREVDAELRKLSDKIRARAQVGEAIAELRFGPGWQDEHRHACPPAPKVARHVHVSLLVALRWLVAVAAGVVMALWTMGAAEGAGMAWWLALPLAWLLGGGAVLVVYAAAEFLRRSVRRG